MFGNTYLLMHIKLPKDLGRIEEVLVFHDPIIHISVYYSL